MQRLIQMSAVLAAAFILIGLYAMPDATIMELASRNPVVYMFRWGILLGSLALLLTKPPRGSSFRTLLGAASVGLLLWTTHSIYLNEFPMLDGLLFLMAGVGFGLAALETTTKPAPKKHRTARA